MEDTRHKDTLVGLLRDPLSERAQRTVQKLCTNEAGRLRAIRALAEALVRKGIVEGTLPPNSGVLSDELADKFFTAAIHTGTAYWERGGYLLARGWCSISDLAAEMENYWRLNFSPSIPVTRPLAAELEPEELNARTCVAALACREAIKELLEAGVMRVTGTMDPSPLPADGELVIDVEKVELLCKKMVSTTLRAFDDPNAVNHEIVHGSSLKTS